MTKIYKSDEGARAVRERYLEMLKRWPAPNEQMRVPTRQGETFIIACGEKAARPLLLFHGSASNSAMWMGDVRAWAEHYRVYSIDLIGEAGLSAPARPPLASEEYALWLDNVLKALSVTHASIVGVSLGGWLALDYNTRQPERVTSIALAVLGGKDVLLDSAATKRRLERNVPQADIRYLPEAGHFIPRQTSAILDFLDQSTGRPDPAKLLT